MLSKQRETKLVIKIMRKLYPLSCVGFIFGIAGCNDANDVTSTNVMNMEHSLSNHWVPDHTHGKGPHGGTIVNWDGDKLFLEFLVNHEKSQTIVYVLEKDETSPFASNAKGMELSIVDPIMQVFLHPSPQEGDPKGKTSRFIGTHKKLATLTEFEGKLSGVINGVPFSRDFKEAFHGDHILHPD